jgi:phage host-nuclease inhibitor protein Gam
MGHVSTEVITAVLAALAGVLGWFSKSGSDRLRTKTSDRTDFTKALLERVGKLESRIDAINTEHHRQVEEIRENYRRQIQSITEHYETRIRRLEEKVSHYERSVPHGGGS